MKRTETAPHVCTTTSALFSFSEKSRPQMHFSPTPFSSCLPRLSLSPRPRLGFLGGRQKTTFVDSAPFVFWWPSKKPYNASTSGHRWRFARSPLARHGRSRSLATRPRADVVLGRFGDRNRPVAAVKSIGRPAYPQPGCLGPLGFRVAHHRRKARAHTHTVKSPIVVTRSRLPSRRSQRAAVREGRTAPFPRLSFFFPQRQTRGKTQKVLLFARSDLGRREKKEGGGGRE